MENLHESGKVYYFKTGLSEDHSTTFGPLLEVNSNFDILKSLHICGGKALGITSNNELLEWEFDSKQNTKNPSIPNPLSSINSLKQKITKKNDYYFLLFKPSYHFHKIKFASVNLNKTMCLGLDINGNVLVWGQNQEGLLGLGYDITTVETPTILSKLKDIKEISLSDYHAVVLNNNGNAFSWGLGKYGELGLERSIYTPTPQQILTDTIYSKVFCGNLITCLLDGNGHFYYFGVIIKQLGGYNNTITLKSLLNDQNYQDGKNIYFEKEIEELDTENFKSIVIGNGFVALLSKNGLLYVLEYNNKLTMLYNKFFLYNITVAYNEIYGLARERPKIEKNKNFKDNYYLCRWNSKCSSENDLYSDIWSTTMWKFKEDFQLIKNCKLLEGNNNRSLLLLKDQDEKYNFANSIYHPHRKNLEISINNNDHSQLDNSVNDPNISAFGDLMLNNHSKKILPEKFLEFNSEYDDSYNIKFKRCKIKLNIRTGIDSSLSYLNNNNKSRTMTHFYRTSQNNNNIINKFNSSVTPLVDANNSTNNNNLFSGSYNIQFDTGKENDNVNILGQDDEEIVDIKEKELRKYRNEVDNIISNFKLKRDSGNLTSNSINNYSRNDANFNHKNKSKENLLFGTNTNKYNNKKNVISDNSSNQNERYSLTNNNQYENENENEDNLFDINMGKFSKKGKDKKLHLTKEGMMNYELGKNKKNNKNKEYYSKYNDSLSRVRKNIISLKDKMQFKDKVLNKLHNCFNLSDNEIIEESENENNNSENNEGGNRNKKNIKKKKKFERASSYSNLNSRKNKKKGKNVDGGENDNNTDLENSDFIDYEDLKGNQIQRYNSVDNKLLKGKDNNNEYNESDYEENENYNDNNLGKNYISGSNYDDYNKFNNSKNKNAIKNSKKYKNNGKNKNQDINNENDEFENEYDGNRGEEDRRKINGHTKRKIKNNKNQNESDDNEEGEEEEENNNFNNMNQNNKKSIKKNKEKLNNFDGGEDNYEQTEQDEDVDDNVNENENTKKNTKKNKRNNNKQKVYIDDNNADEQNKDANLIDKKTHLKKHI